MRVFLFVSCFSFLCVPAFGSDFSLRDLGGGNAEISKYEGSSASVTVPATLDGKRVVSVGAWAFFGNEFLREVALPEGLTAIGEGAFAQCPALERVAFPSSLKKISAHAFSGCVGLSQVALPASLESLGAEAFAHCDALKSVSGPDTLDELGAGAFPLSAPALFPQARFPALEIESFTLEDASGDLAIDADERCALRVALANRGEADAYGCRFRIVPARENSALAFPRSLGVVKIPAGKSVVFSLPIRAAHGLADGEAEFAFSLKEPRGLDSEERRFVAQTRAFAPPALKIADSRVSVEGGSRLRKNSPFALQVYLQNIGKGAAENVAVEIELPKGVFLLDGEERREFAAFRSGAAEPLEYSILVPSRFRGNEIPVRVKISEKYGEYAESWTQTFTLNSVVATGKTIFRPKPGNDAPKIRLASFSSGVDKDIPRNPEDRSRNVFVAVVANENYSDVERVPHAVNDGLVFAEYAKKTLGVPERNVHVETDATSGKMRAAERWIEDAVRVYPEAEVIFYYAGHGVPVIRDGKITGKRLLPTDVLAADAEFSAVDVDAFLARLGELGAKQVTVFLDACFSGTLKKGDRLARAATGPVTAYGKMVVFSAASGDQSAQSLDDEKHGLFTYCLLKKLQDTKGDLTWRELGEHLERRVPQLAHENGLSVRQTPTMSVSGDFDLDRKITEPK